MTIAQVNKAVTQALSQSKYLALRDSYGRLRGYNPRIANTKRFSNTDKNSTKESWVKGYRIIDFMEYITIKEPFIL